MTYTCTVQSDKQILKWENIVRPFCLRMKFGPLNPANQVQASNMRFWPCEIN